MKPTDGNTSEFYLFFSKKSTKCELPKMVFICFCEREIRGGSLSHKNFSGKCGEIRAKILAPPKICLLLPTPMIGKIRVKRFLNIIVFTRGGDQTCSMYEPHIVKPMLQRAAT